MTIFHYLSFTFFVSNHLSKVFNKTDSRCIISTCVLHLSVVPPVSDSSADQSPVKASYKLPVISLDQCGDSLFSDISNGVNRTFISLSTPTSSSFKTGVVFFIIYFNNYHIIFFYNFVNTKHGDWFFCFCCSCKSLFKS